MEKEGEQEKKNKKEEKNKNRQQMAQERQEETEEEYKEIEQEDQENTMIAKRWKETRKMRAFRIRSFNKPHFTRTNPLMTKCFLRSYACNMDTFHRTRRCFYQSRS